MAVSLNLHLQCHKFSVVLGQSNVTLFTQPIADAVSWVILLLLQKPVRGLPLRRSSLALLYLVDGLGKLHYVRGVNVDVVSFESFDLDD